MQGFIGLVKRNMNMYLRNRTSVLFSFLSMMIILALNSIFLGDINKNYLQRYITLEDIKAGYITGSWLMAGVVIVNVVMVVLATLEIMVQDEETHKMIAFLVAPIKRTTLTLSYVVAACMNAFLLSMTTLIFSQVYLYISCKAVLPFGILQKVCLVILVTIFSLVAFFICLATVVHTSSAFSAISTAVGTLIGFISGIYLPIGSLSETVQNALKCFPILYGTALTRELFTKEAIAEGFNDMPQSAIDGYKAFMGTSIYWGDYKVSFLMDLLILVGSGILFTGIAVILLKHKKARDR